jgi:hypothetical protein
VVVAGDINFTGTLYQNGSPFSGGSSTHYIGESFGGGIVFYVYDNGQHGLIASTVDQATGIAWNNIPPYTNTHARADGIGAGKANTVIIIASQGASQEPPFAATFCNEYSVTIDGVTYGDWYLPSKYELNMLYMQKDVVGGFSSTHYWSSTEDYMGDAWKQEFSNGMQDHIAKIAPNNVRAVRAF